MITFNEFDSQPRAAMLSIRRPAGTLIAMSDWYAERICSDTGGKMKALSVTIVYNAVLVIFIVQFLSGCSNDLGADPNAGMESSVAISASPTPAPITPQPTPWSTPMPTPTPTPAPQLVSVLGCLIPAGTIDLSNLDQTFKNIQNLVSQVEQQIQLLQQLENQQISSAAIQQELQTIQGALSALQKFETCLQSKGLLPNLTTQNTSAPH